MRDDMFRHALKSCARLGFVLPEYNKMRGVYLDKLKLMVSECVRKKIFDLYFTTKPEGTGLGLSIVQKIIAEHKGTIEVTSDSNKITKFKITIPQK